VTAQWPLVDMPLAAFRHAPEENLLNKNISFLTQESGNGKKFGYLS
jgi:hypothetical protein